METMPFSHSHRLIARAHFDDAIMPLLFSCHLHIQYNFKIAFHINERLAALHRSLNLHHIELAYFVMDCDRRWNKRLYCFIIQNYFRKNHTFLFINTFIINMLKYLLKIHLEKHLEVFIWKTFLWPINKTFMHFRQIFLKSGFDCQKVSEHDLNRRLDWNIKKENIKWKIANFEHQECD